MQYHLHYCQPILDLQCGSGVARLGHTAAFEERDAPTWPGYEARLTA